jgi:hypothetical protein
MIDRLIEFRDAAPEGGETHVVISDFGKAFETAVLSVIGVVVTSRDEDGTPTTWEQKHTGNTHKVIRVF